MRTIRIISSLICVAMLLIPCATASATGASPSPRGYAQMTYDSCSGLVILYGGQTTGNWWDSATWNHETWTFNPETNVWTEKHPPDHPDANSGGDMTYDSMADRSILTILPNDWIFGTATRLQTWAYDDNSDTWTRLADGPRYLGGQRIVYDSESDRVILFGGQDATTFDVMNETWAYDYNTNTWTNMQPAVSPRARNYHGMTYDAKADRVVMWGGAGARAELKGAVNAAVWTYDYNTNTWQEQENQKDTPSVRYYIFLAYDSKADRIIMYGGYAYGNDETWVYDLNTDTWQQMQPAANPGALSRFNLVYARDANKTILFGGQLGAVSGQYVGDTWSYSLRFNRWTNISP